MWFWFNVKRLLFDKMYGLAGRLKALNTKQHNKHGSSCSERLSLHVRVGQNYTMSYRKLFSEFMLQIISINYCVSWETWYKIEGLFLKNNKDMFLITGPVCRLKNMSAQQ